MKFAYEINGKPVPAEHGRAIAMAATTAMIGSRITGRVARLPDSPERRSVGHAMLMVEIRLVKAFWTIARLPLGNSAPGGARHCGIEYLHGDDDSHARYIDAPSGKWDTPTPRPSRPSSKDIDAANEALDWLLLVRDEKARKLLVVGATAKRGDAGRRIPWIRIRPSLPEFADISQRTLQHRYSQSLREIVSELTLAGVHGR